MSKPRTLYVIQISHAHATSMGWSITMSQAIRGIWFRCNKKGLINWEKTLFYSTRKLIERNNVKIVESFI